MLGSQDDSSSENCLFVRNARITSFRPSLTRCLLERLDGCGIVRLAQLIGGILDLDDAVIAIDYDN
jgi:hypothetical protein